MTIYKRIYIDLAVIVAESSKVQEKKELQGGRSFKF